MTQHEAPSEHDGDAGVFVEDDHAETPMTFGPGGVPSYVLIAWGLMAVGYIWYVATHTLPDLSSWGMP